MLFQVRTRQQAFVFRTWGGARKGAGRRPHGDRALASHLRRPALAPRFPVHVTWRMRPGVWNLRARRCLRVLEDAFWASVKPTFRVVHYSVMGNHIHLMVEAADAGSLARGMQGLGIRIAKRLNVVMGRGRGRVVSDRYHARILRSPTETKRVRLYLLNNARNHFGLTVPDGCASQVSLHLPCTYLLRLVC